MIPNGIAQTLIELYGIDITKYDIDFASATADYEPSRIEAALQEATFVMTVLALHAQKLSAKDQDNYLELLTVMMIHHLQHDTDDSITITPGVFEALAILTKEGGIDIHEKYLVSLAPALLNYVSKSIADMSMVRQRHVFKTLYVLPQVWPSIPDTIWAYANILTESAYINVSNIAAKIMVAAAPDKYMSDDIRLEGFNALLLEGGDLISVNQLSRHMQKSLRPLSLWSNWIPLSSPQDWPLSGTNANLLDMLKNHPFKPGHRDTWHAWSLLDDFYATYEGTMLHKIIKELRSRNPEIQQFYEKYASVAKSMSQSDTDIAGALVDLYVATVRPIDEVVINHNIFTVSP